MADVIKPQWRRYWGHGISSQITILRFKFQNTTVIHTPSNGCVKHLESRGTSGSPKKTLNVPRLSTPAFRTVKGDWSEPYEATLGELSWDGWPVPWPCSYVSADTCISRLQPTSFRGVALSNPRFDPPPTLHFGGLEFCGSLNFCLKLHPPSEICWPPVLRGCRSTRCRDQWFRFQINANVFWDI